MGLYLALFWAPPDALMGDVQRIMYIHFPSWLATGLAYVVGFVCSGLYLLHREPRWDGWAAAGVEVGVVFNVVGLLTGSIWGRPTWGVWWTWDPRLTTTAIMLTIFVGYLLVRAFVEDPEARGRIAAVVAVVGFVDVPIVYFSVRWWRTLHQPQSTPETVDPEMVIALRVMFLAFLLLFAHLLLQRYRLARTRREIERRILEEETVHG